MKNVPSRALAVLVVALLGAPAALRSVPGIPEWPLVGRSAELAPTPVFTLASWFSGSFQEAALRRANQAFAFRTWLVRLNNQMAFSLWGKAKANGVLIGPGLFLSDRLHVEAWNGTDFVGEAAIRARLAALGRLDAALRSRGGGALLVVVPGKATTHSELVPHGSRPPFAPRNREVYARLAPGAEAPFLDLTPRFLEHRRTSPYPLYSPYGIHWTALGAVLGMQEILASLGERTGRELPRIEILEIEETDRIQPVDRDIGDGMNLLFPLPKVKLAYPKIRVVTEGKWRPRVLVVADSTFWNVFDLPLSGQVFSSLRFWFYRNELHEHGKPMTFPKGDAALAQLLSEADVVLILAADANLPRVGWGFLEDVDRLLAAGDGRPAGPVR
jgi:hypothetical protein